MKVLAMAAQYTPVTLKEMDQFLRRAFRAMDPTTGVKYGEIYYDLSVEEGSSVVVRVYTSIGERGEQAAGLGADAIRIGLFSKAGRPLKAGKLPIVKRTQNWRDNLRERISDEVEDYHDKEAYWESRAR